MKFGEIAEIANGQVSPTEEPYGSSLHIGPENIESGSGRLFGLKIARDLGLISGKYLFDEASVVYSKVRPNLNKVCRPDFVGICSADCYPLWPKKELVTRDFLFHAMSSQGFVRQATDVSARSGMPKINRRDLSLVQVLVPPLHEQVMISRILDGFSSAHEVLSRLLEARSRFRKLFREALTRRSGLVRLPLLGILRAARDHGARRISHQSGTWMFPKTSQLFESVSRKRHGHEPVLSVTQDQGVVRRDRLDRKINMKMANTGSYKLVEPGDFIISLRSFQGGLEYSSHRGLVSPAYHVIRPKVEVADGFYRHYFKSPEFVKRLAVAVIGIRDGKQVSYDDFSFMRVPFPPIEEQRRIADTLDAVDREIDLLKQQADALARQKKGLMEKLLTGQIRVKG